MGATGVTSQRKTIEESIERNKEKYIKTSHDIHAIQRLVIKNFMHQER